jgi:hypothetical protein
MYLTTILGESLEISGLGREDWRRKGERTEPPTPLPWEETRYWVGGRKKSPGFGRLGPS